MLRETCVFQGGQFIRQKWVRYEDPEEPEDPEDSMFPFANLTDHELQALNPPDYMEDEGWIAYFGEWMMLDFHERWSPWTNPVMSVFPFSDLTDEELSCESLDPTWFPETDLEW